MPWPKPLRIEILLEARASRHSHQRLCHIVDRIAGAHLLKPRFVEVFGERDQLCLILVPLRSQNAGAARVGRIAAIARAEVERALRNSSFRSRG